MAVDVVPPDLGHARLPHRRGLEVLQPVLQVGRVLPDFQRVHRLPQDVHQRVHADVDHEVPEEGEAAGDEADVAQLQEPQAQRTEARHVRERVVHLLDLERVGVLRLQALAEVDHRPGDLLRAGVDPQLALDVVAVVVVQVAHALAGQPLRLISTHVEQHLPVAGGQLIEQIPVGGQGTEVVARLLVRGLFGFGEHAAAEGLAQVADLPPGEVRGRDHHRVLFGEHGAGGENPARPVEVVGAQVALGDPVRQGCRVVRERQRDRGGDRPRPVQRDIVDGADAQDCAIVDPLLLPVDRGDRQLGVGHQRAGRDLDPHTARRRHGSTGAGLDRLRHRLAGLYHHQRPHDAPRARDAMVGEGAGDGKGVGELLARHQGAAVEERRIVRSERRRTGAMRGAGFHPAHDQRQVDAEGGGTFGHGVALRAVVGPHDRLPDERDRRLGIRAVIAHVDRDDLLVCGGLGRGRGRLAAGRRAVGRGPARQDCRGG